MHWLRGCGLPNVQLVDGFLIHERDQSVSYQDLSGLYQALAQAVACRGADLTSEEFRFLRKRLEALKIVDQPPSDPSRIYFSAHVELEDEDGKLLKLRIVGPDEIDPKQQHISIDSPMARALLGKQLDDEICVMAPGGERLYWVTDIRY